MVATRLNIKTNAEIQKNGLSALQEKLGGYRNHQIPGAI